MRTVNVYKNAAGFTYELDFAAGITTWNFISQHTGKLMKAVTSNVASYKIGGNSVTYPFQLTNGNSYTVQIVPTNAGLPATIKFYADDIDSYSFLANATNFISGTGRYLYVLTAANNIVYKLDTSLLLPANYAGSGVWTVNPIVATITLPTLPNSGTYSTMFFATLSQVNYVVVLGGSGTAQSSYYGVKIKENDSVWDMSVAVQNSYTTLILNQGWAYGSLRNVYFDFVNNKAYSIQSGASSVNVILNLNTNTIGSSSITSLSAITTQLAYRQFQFDPYLQRFSFIGDFSVDGKFYNYKPTGSSITYSAYDLLTGYTIRNQYGGRFFRYYDNYGQLITSYGDFNSYNWAANTELTRATFIDETWCHYLMGYNIQKPGKTTSAGANSLATAATSQTSMVCATPSNYAGTWFTFGVGGSGIYRLHCFKTSESVPNFGYLDFANAVTFIATNQLIL
jgi:hypothetical protein